MVVDGLAQGAFGNRHYTPSDSRLLNNLIKAERNYVGHLHASVTASHGASSALTAWGTSEAPDVAEASSRIADLLAACADVQSTNVAAIEGYRSALKDVADREASIRSVVRDRDILVGRLIKASQKSAHVSNKKGPEERAEKVAKAQKELAACEEVLASEENALVGVKRRTFKEALTMRMKTMGDAGAAMVDAAKEAILLLDSFDSNTYQMPRNISFDSNVDDLDGNPEADDAHQAHPVYQNAPYDHTEHLHVNHPNFENSSVTPSQSASQIYQPRSVRDSVGYSAPFDGIHEVQAANAFPIHPSHDDVDSDDEDFRQSFAPDNHDIHVNQASDSLPAPHQIHINAGAHSAFLPNQQVPKRTHVEALESRIPSSNALQPPVAPQAETPAPTPPAKDQEKRLSRNDTIRASNRAKNKQPQRDLHYVPMPPVPTAPQLDSSGVRMAPIPTAPKLYMPGASGDHDSSSEEDHTRKVAHRGGGSEWNTRIRAPQHDVSSDEEGTARHVGSHAQTASRKGFLGRMGMLFKGGESPAKESPQVRTRKSSSGQWETRTDSNLRHSLRVKDPANRQSGLRGPLVPEPESSGDELPDERKLVRHVNKGRPLWQGGKSNSDLGPGSLVAKAKPGTLRRTPSATVNAGPLSWRASQEASKRSSAEETRPLSPPLARTSTTPKKKKKVKKVSSMDDVNQTAKLARNSVVVSGDASAGIRRSESLNYGKTSSASNALARRSSKRLSAMAVQPVHGAPAGSKAGAMRPVDPQGKFATGSWVAKSNTVHNDADAKGKASNAAPSAPPKPQNKTLPPARSHQDQPSPKHVPQPSATTSPPLKPALKVPGSSDLARAGSTTSSIAGSRTTPILPAPVSAPPPASSILDGNNALPQYETHTPVAKEPVPPAVKAPASALSIGEDKTFDGTGHLDMPQYSTGPSISPIKRTALPRIDMPASEPFRVDLGGGSQPRVSTPQRELASAANGSPVLSSNEKQVYRSLLARDGYDRSEGKGHDAEMQMDRVAADSNSAATPTRPSKLSRTYSGEIPLSSDSSDDEDAIRQTESSKSFIAPPEVKDQTPEGSGVGSGVSRRKSVRMAPDVKFPSETAEKHAEADTPHGLHHSKPTPHLSTRIAPPPTAPARLHSPPTDRPIDLGSRNRSTWNTRIGSTYADDSSSDEAEGGTGASEYEMARRNFGTISQSWGKATGSKYGDRQNHVADFFNIESPKKKKPKTTTSSSGYNPSIRLPPGMEVVGRSGSIQRK